MFIVYGKDGCTYCTQATQLLQSKKQDFLYKKLEDDFSREDLIDTLKVYGVVPKTLPQITKDGAYVGGYHELRNLLS